MINMYVAEARSVSAALRLTVPPMKRTQPLARSDVNDRE